MSTLSKSALDILELPQAEFQRIWSKLPLGHQELIVAETQRRYRVIEYPSPGDLAQALDPTTVQTPALQLVDSKLIEVGKALQVMYSRRGRLVELIDERQQLTGRKATGRDIQGFIEQASDEIAPAGINRLIISMPWQEGKSTRVNRYGVEWFLRQFPTLKIVLVSYDGINANRISYQVRSDIELFNGVDEDIDLGLRLMGDQKAMGRWMLRTGGGVYAIGIGGGLTGHPSDCGSIDDPVKDIQAAESDLRVRQQMDWYQTTFRPRLAPWAPIMLTTTRWADNDLAGQLMEKTAQDKAAGIKDYDDWEVVNISAQADFDPLKGESDVLGREPGEFMLSARGRTQADWEATKNATPARYWSCMYQGNPTPGTGTILLRHWWRRYEEVMWVRRPDGTFDVPGYELSQSWDMTFKDTKGTDFVVGALWAKKGADAYLIWIIRARLDFPRTIDAVRRMSYTFPRCRAKFVEDTANGPAVIASLKHEIPGMMAIKTRGESKTSRAEAGSPFVRAGNFWIPSAAVANTTPELAFDPESFIDECTAFPNGNHDDQVDMWSQYAREKFIRSSVGRVLSASDVTQRPKKDEGQPQSELAKRLAQRRS